MSERIQKEGNIPSIFHSVSSDDRIFVVLSCESLSPPAIVTMVIIDRNLIFSSVFSAA